MSNSFKESVLLISSLKIESNGEAENGHDQDDHEISDVVHNLEDNTDQRGNLVTKLQEIEGLDQEEDDSECFEDSLVLHAWIWVVDSCEYKSIEHVENKIEPGVWSQQEFPLHLYCHLRHND